MKKKTRRRLLFGVGVLLLSFVTLKFYFFRPPTEVAPQQFITRIAPTAKKSMERYHIPASITIAQAALESNFGQSELAQKYHNLFGIKAEPFEPNVLLPTTEYQNGQAYTIDQRFRVYPSWEASILAHARLLTEGTSWNAQQYERVLRAQNYQQAAYALQQADYATDPAYAQKLIALIEQYQLGQYDQ